MGLPSILYRVSKGFAGMLRLPNRVKIKASNPDGKYVADIGLG